MSTPQSWHEILRLETDTTLEARKAKTTMGVAVGATVVAILGVVLAVTLVPVVGWIVFGIAAIISLLYFYLSWASTKLSRLSGDDLIDVVVADEGVRGNGGLTMAWSEIASIEISGIDMTVRGRSAQTALITQQAMNSALEDGGMSAKVSIMTVHLRDHDAVKARASTPMQQGLIDPPKGERLAKVTVSLGQRSDEQVDLFLKVVSEQAARHGVPVASV